MATMPFLEFFAIYNGKTVDVDSYPKGNIYQCVDLMRKYCEEVIGLGLYALPTGNAKDIYVRTPFNHRYFKKIPNLPWTVPKQGDIVIWKEPFGPYTEVVNGKQVRKYAGHVAIVNEANVKRFSSFDQNFSPDLKCRLVEHNYQGVLGFLRFRGK